jgi:hypothetical protein
LKRGGKKNQWNSKSRWEEGHRIGGLIFVCLLGAFGKKGLRLRNIGHAVGPYRASMGGSILKLSRQQKYLML